MKCYSSILSPLLLTTLIACPKAPHSEGSEPSSSKPTPTAATVASTPKPEVSTSTSTSSMHDDKKAEAAKKLAAERAKLVEDTKIEAARFTPELHAAAKKLAATEYPTLEAALDAVLKSKHRMPKNIARDSYRHPLETLKFFGLKPTMTVLEYGPGEGWYTEILAPTLAAKGKLLISMTDPNGPPDLRSTFYGERQKLFLEKAPELFGKVERILINSDQPKFGLENKVDMVLVMRALHGLHRSKLLPTFFAEVHKALKPNGILGIEQHRAKPQADPDASAKLGYLPEAFVIQQIESAGFKLTAKSEINANPKDTKDYADGVWVLPPTYQLKDKDHDKYMTIGESDRMTLRFVKIAK